jgi:hypothetical protein
MKKLPVAFRAPAAGLLSLGVLTACTTADERGVSSVRVFEQRSAVEGFYIENIDTQKTSEGLRKVQNILLTVNVISAVDTANQAKYLSYFLHLAWAINDVRPDGSVVLIFGGANHEPKDWRKSAQEMGLKLEPSLNSSVVALSVTTATDAFGSWPGSVPVIPTPNPSDDQ